jgi:ATP-dependent helicase/nuclease subunit B
MTKTKGAIHIQLSLREGSYFQLYLSTSPPISAYEARLGFVPITAHEATCAACLLGRIGTSGAFWAESAAKDPLATTLRLLRWNEQLRLAGWQGQAVSSRLGQLAELVEGAEPGMPERTARVIEALKVQEVDLDAIELLGISRSELPVLFRRLLDALEAKGTVITETPIEPATGKGDLAGCLKVGYTPAGTGELRMIRPQGPLAAADLVAAWLASLDDLEGTVVIGGDEILDNALHKFGLPTLGADRAPGSDPLLQILPLVIALGWLPQDPHLALELLSLPESPVPQSIAGGLVRALRQWPAIGSNDWNKALMLGVESIPDPERKKRIVERLGILLKLTASGNEFPASDMDRRVGALETWAKGKAKAAEAQADRWDCLLQQLASFRRLYQATGLSSLARPLVEKLIRAATEQVVLPPMRIAEAGIESVSEPGTILAPVRRVVWWNFTERSAPSVERSILTPEEKTALETLGCEFPDPAVQAAQFSRAWRRPLQMATDSVLLVCPKFGADGEPEAPHPLWDEISSRLGSEQVAKLIDEMPPRVFKNRPVPSLETPKPKLDWQLGPGVLIPQPESFSPRSVLSLLGNPLYWVLEYSAELASGRTEALPEGVLVMGRIAHKMIGEVLASCIGGQLLSPEAAANEVGRKFDSEGPKLFAGLFMPGNDRERASLRRTIVHAAGDIFRYLGRTGASIIAVEKKLEDRLDGFAFKGTPDLVISHPDLILDFKWGKPKDRREELEAGGSIQLSIYAMLAGGGPAIGYYITSRQELLVNGVGLTGARRVEGPEPGRVWTATHKRLVREIEELARGRVRDMCAEVEDHTPLEKSLLMGDLIFVAPQTEYSPFAWISRKPVD